MLITYLPQLNSLECSPPSWGEEGTSLYLKMNYLHTYETAVILKSKKHTLLVVRHSLSIFLEYELHSIVRRERGIELYSAHVLYRWDGNSRKWQSECQYFMLPYSHTKPTSGFFWWKLSSHQSIEMWYEHLSYQLSRHRRNAAVPPWISHSFSCTNCGRKHDQTERLLNTIMSLLCNYYALSDFEESK